MEQRRGPRLQSHHRLSIPRGETVLSTCARFARATEPTAYLSTLFISIVCLFKYRKILNKPVTSSRVLSRVLQCRIKDRFFIEPWPIASSPAGGSILCAKREEERERERKLRHGIIPRDFRSEYSLTGHSFHSATFAVARRGERAGQVYFSQDDRV